MGTFVWKVMGTGGAILAGIVASKVVGAVWAKAGQDEINPQNPDAPLLKALTYAAVTGLAVAATRTVIQRKAAQYYRESAGHLPKGIEPKQAKGKDAEPTDANSRDAEPAPA